MKILNNKWELAESIVGQRLENISPVGEVYGGLPRSDRQM